MDRPHLRDLHIRHVRDEQPLPRALEAELRNDPRPGAQRLLRAVEARRRRRRAEGQRRRRMLRHERALLAEGLARIAGVDEAGMSPWAGPIVAAAVILPEGFDVPGIDDSKRLTPRARETLAADIRRGALAWAIGSASDADIARLNLFHAGRLALRRAVAGLRPQPDALLVDARAVPGWSRPQRGIVGGDRESYSVAAASILAKTTRDAFMVKLDRLYPGYGFAEHKGYGVPAHRAALVRQGPCPAHRRAFEAVRRCLADAGFTLDGPGSGG